MRNLLPVLALIAALSIASLGLLGASFTIGMAIVGPEADRLAMITFGASLVVLSVSFGPALTWHAWQAMQGHPSVSFRPRLAWLLVPSFLLAVLLGQVILSLDLLPVVTFPLFHVAAAVLPPLTILALVGQRFEGIVSWRDIVLMTASGAFLSTALAFTLEAVAVSGLVMAAFVGLALRPGGPELLQTVATHFQDPARLQDLPIAPASLLSPIIVLVLFVVVCGLIPVFEEAVKAVGVGLMGYRRPTLSQAFLWGLACGAGFALVEGMLNTASGLEAWAAVILLRVGATLVHCFTGALMGMAWYWVLAQRRWQYGLGLYAASVALHSLWNALSVGLALLSLSGTGAGMPSAGPSLAGLGAVGVLAAMVLLALGIALGLAGLAWRVRRHDPDTDLAGSQLRVGEGTNA